MFSVSDGVTIEWVGDEAVVLCDHVRSTDVVRVSGRLAETLLSITRGDVVDADSSEVRELIRLGLVSTPRQGMSRRSVLGAGATLGAAGVAMMTLPSAAASLSTDVVPEEPTGIPVPIPAEPNQANNEITVTQVAQTSNQDSKFSFELPVARIQNWAVIEAWLSDETRVRTLQVGNFGLAGVVRTNMEFVVVGGVVTAVKSERDVDIFDFSVAPQMQASGSSTIQLRLRERTVGEREDGDFSADFNVSWPAFSAG